MAIRFELILLVTWMYLFSVAKGCGPLPAGRGRSIRFTLSGFHLPPVMVYSDDATAKVIASTISTTKNGAETFVQNLMMQSVKDVLYERGRSAFLADYLIDSILQQLDIQISYDPLKCDKVIDTSGVDALGNMMVNCVIIDGTVTNICMHAQPNMCMLQGNADKYKSIEPKYMTISGSLTTTNAIMANWSNQMWESVLNRVLRSISSSSNGSHFYGASIRIS